MSDTPRRLWDKKGDSGSENGVNNLDALIHRFTVGDDPHWDRELLIWDCRGSAAHVRTLERARLLTAREADALIAELARISALAREGRFDIPPELEDGHTAIEAHLTRVLGSLGEKIHAGRSRNDQVATAMRLYLRDAVLRFADGLGDFVGRCIERIETDGAAPMPGYTHLQPAMPSSIGQWLHAFAEGAVEQLRACLATYDFLDACPLGTGAGFGVPLPLDRAYTAELLGFSRVQRSPIDVQNSRGRHELYVARLAADIGGILEKLAWDMILYATAEFGFIALPKAMTTGSSIMPQKRNPDVLELLRARTGRLRAWAHEIEAITGKLPSSYHRDLQLTKAPVLRAVGDTRDMLIVASRVVEGFEIHHDRLAAAMRPELYATRAALDKVREGMPFRQAYREVAGAVSDGSFDASPFMRAGASDGQVQPGDLLGLTEEWDALRLRLNALRAQNDAAAAILVTC